MNWLKKLNPVNSLFGRIFLWFWLAAILLVVTGAWLAKQSNESYSVRPINESQASQLNDVANRVEIMADRRPDQLSGGQQQRVAIARAMVSRPDLILADEPTANLDSTTGGELLDMMRRLNETRGMTFVFSTHDRMIMERSGRLATLADGRIDSDEVRG